MAKAARQHSKHEQRDGVNRLEKMFLGKRTRNMLTVYAILRHVSKSRMTRVIDFFVIRNGVPVRISWAMSKALRMPYCLERDGLIVKGYGMDMAHHVVHNLARCLYHRRERNPDKRKRVGYRLHSEWI